MTRAATGGRRGGGVIMRVKTRMIRKRDFTRAQAAAAARGFKFDRARSREGKYWFFCKASSVSGPVRLVPTKWGLDVHIL